MPSEKLLNYYRIGLRLTQALTLIPDQELPKYAAAAMPAIDGLLAAVSVGVERGFIGNAALPAIEMLRQTRNSSNSDGSERGLIENFRRIRQNLLNLRQMLEEFLHQFEPGDGTLWFQLGQTIADGIDRSWSDGQLYWDANPDPENPYPQLRSREPHPPQWTWSNESHMNELLQRLGESLEHCFPRMEALDESDWELFPTLPRERFWGWRSLEVGLRRLNIRPHWETDQRILFVGHTEVRRYRNPASNQISILEAFHAAGWPRSIERSSGIGGENIQATIRDLNNGIAPALIVFRAEGGSAISYELWPSSRDSRP